MKFKLVNYSNVQDYDMIVKYYRNIFYQIVIYYICMVLYYNCYVLQEYNYLVYCMFIQYSMFLF